MVNSLTWGPDKVALTRQYSVKNILTQVGKSFRAPLGDSKYTELIRLEPDLRLLLYQGHQRFRANSCQDFVL